MVTISFDPDANTLYWYFTDLIAGSTAYEGECAAYLLLDAEEQLLGIQLELDENVSERDLAQVLQHPQVRYDPNQALLAVRMIDQPPTTILPLEEPAILDFDQDEQLQGCEIVVDRSFVIAEKLARLTPFLIALEESAEEPFDPALSEQTPQLTTDTSGEGFRAGFVALIGRPNVGKSTLLNALLGQKIAIVSPKPQTTRLPIRGILSQPNAQVIFVDTPGIHDPRTKLGAFMVDQARRAIPDADVICMVVDISSPPRRLDKRIADMARRSRAPKILVLNKVDLRNPQGQAYVEEYRALGPWDMEVAVSALRQQGIETLLEEIIRRLPTGPRLYPEDQLTDQSQRELAAELVREQVLRYTQQEVPHGVAIEVEEWEEKEHTLYIRMTIYVEKESQKGIVIGGHGAMLKRIGSAARQAIEQQLGRTIYLELWVKARQNWRDDPTSLHWLGYTSRSR